MMKFSFFLVLFFPFLLLAQDLMEERIRRISPRKRSIYFNRGIFHNGGPKVESSLIKIRHNYTERLGYERVVFDFATKKVPRVYGHMSNNEKKLYVDFFDTKMKKGLGSFGKTKYVKRINMYPLSKESLSTELVFASNVSIDIFYLENPGRLVIDIKK